MIGMGMSGILVFIALAMFVLNVQQYTTVEINQFVLLIAIAIAGHSLIHAHQELHYGYNPLAGQWRMRDVPVQKRM